MSQAIRLDSMQQGYHTACIGIVAEWDGVFLWEGPTDNIMPKIRSNLCFCESEGQIKKSA